MSLWRVYLPEWLTVYVSDEPGVAGREDCWTAFEEKYKGRVRAEDWQIVPFTLHRVLRLKLPNLQGEYKDRAGAEWLVKDCGAEAVLVEQGSPEEQVLLDYGKKMLKT